MTTRFDASGKPTAQALAQEKELQQIYPAYRGVDDEYIHAGKDALERWLDRKFGLRIHWSLYSISGLGPESWPMQNGPTATPVFRSQYEELARWWTPSLFDADDWCDWMVRSGLKFFSFTTKHHDGFSMYDTRTRVKRRFVHTGPGAPRIVDCDLAYSIMESPFGRDIVGELVQAGRKRDLGISLYFSHIDWFDADFRIDQSHYYRDLKYTLQSDPAGFARMIARHREQIRELLTRYGPIDQLSLDMCLPSRELGIWDEMVRTAKMARRLQPQVLMRNRGIDQYGDYTTPERFIPFGADAEDSGSSTNGFPWKVIYPGSKHFSHVWADEYHPASWVVGHLVDVTAKGGNFQVGYGPGPDGRFDKHIIATLEEVGDWLKVNGQAIYATRPHRAFKDGDDVRYTRTKDNRFVYAIFLRWPQGPYAVGSVRLANVRARSGSQITMLGLDHNFRYTQDDQALTIEIPAWLADPAKRPCQHAFAFKIEQALT